MRVGNVAVALVIAGLTAGCGGDDPTEPESFGNEGGIGTQSLLVQAVVDVDEVVGGFLTVFRVTVRDRAGEPVLGADVTVEGNFTPLRLEDEESEGIYRSQLAGAASGALKLRVQKDDMFVRDVVLGNIGVHAFIEPDANDTVAAGESLMVRWLPDREAPFARLSTLDFNWADIPDDGTFVVPDSMNPARSNQWIELLRSNEVQISGGLRGSYFRMEVRKSVGPVVVE